MYVNGAKTHQFKTKDSEKKTYLLYLGKILKGFTVDNLKNTPDLNGYLCDFTVDYHTIDASNIVHTHKYLTEKTFGSIIKVLISLLILIVSVIASFLRFLTAQIINHAILNQILSIQILINTVNASIVTHFG